MVVQERRFNTTGVYSQRTAISKGAAYLYIKSHNIKSLVLARWQRIFLPSPQPV